MPHPPRPTRLSARLVVAMVLVASVLALPRWASAADPAPSSAAPNAATPIGVMVEPEVTATVAAEGSVRVVVDVASDPTDDPAQIDARVAAVQSALPPGSFESVTNSTGYPDLSLTVDALGLDALTSTPGVVAVELSRFFTAMQIAGGALGPEASVLSTNATTVEGATVAWAAGELGAGTAVAVLDTGVDVTHPFLTATARTVWEGCFATSAGGYSSPCPGGVSMGITAAPVPGSAAPCALLDDGCSHGTHVAGIALGGTGLSTVSGVAPAADLVAVQVFVTNPSAAPAQRVTAWDYDVLNALRWLHNMKASTFPGLASVNLSLGGGASTGYCDGSEPDYFDAFATLRSDGVLTAVASGNEGYSNAVAHPGCVSNAITVGAVDDTSPTLTSTFSNDGLPLDIAAPGERICSSVPAATSGSSNCPAPNGGKMRYQDGTSMATPAVAGAIASLAGAGIPFAQRESALRKVASGGTTVTASAFDVPLLRVDVALGLTPAASLVGVVPERILDTRVAGGAFWPDETRNLSVIGRGNVPVQGAVAVALNITVDAPTAGGYLTVYPKGEAEPDSSNVNFVPGETVPNLVIVPIGANGSISIHNFTGWTHVIVDTVGWVTSVGSIDSPLTPSSVAPQRLLDTRVGPAYTTIDGAYQGIGPIGSGGTLALDVLGRGSVPTSGVGSVVLNVTTAGSTAGGFLTVYPTGSALPTASSLNFLPGEVASNLVLADVGSGGYVNIYNLQGATQVVVDILGWFPTTSTTFNPIVPTRFMDTRAGEPTFDGLAQGTGPIGPNSVRTLQITGRGGIVPSTISAVALNVTATRPTASGYLTVYPTGSTTPEASNLNFVPGQTIPNAVVARVGSDGRVAIYNFAGWTDVVVDVVGWFP